MFLLIDTTAARASNRSSESTGHALFASMLWPLSPASFFRDHFERAPLFQHRDARGWYGGEQVSLRDQRGRWSTPKSKLDLQLWLPELLHMIDSGGSVFEPLREDGAPSRMVSAKQSSRAAVRAVMQVLTRTVLLAFSLSLDRLPLISSS
jgi:hypothetical protein